MAHKNKLKAWVRYDGKGRLVGGGPILQADKPKNGDWVEVPYEDCCVPTSTSTTTSTTTEAPVFERASFINNVPIVFRGGTFTSKADMYAGNTVANITATNSTYQISGLKSQELQVFRGENYIFDFLANPLASPDVVVPTYVNTDSGGNPILLTLQDFYEYNKKIIINSFFATRNPVINIFRATNPGYISGLDAFFVIAIDFDATGLEQRAYNIDFREYQYVNLPGTVTYPTVCQLPLSANINATIPPQTLTLLPPSSGWTIGQTVESQWVIQEAFPIPGTW